ncbi:MAG: hypothetical protein M0P19_08360 [Nevskia sp.]|jgi:hypothetical protein|nr:hypothetical protein [Nevskia sp.]MCK9385061.1 hypothetical protein [Nevskia sp.]
MKRIHILKTGTFTGSGSTEFTFSAADLKAIADNYDPKFGEAPLTVGHPKTDHPAFGWVDRLEFAAGPNGTANLYAIPKTVPPEFSAAVERGAFKKISVALFGPSQAANPKPGSYYLRHVGFLGAHVPAVPGLSPIEFAAAEAPAVSLEFSAPGAYSVAYLFRRLRDWLIADRGLDIADQVLPDYSVNDLENVARLPDEDANESADGTYSPSFAAAKEQPMLNPTQADLDARKSQLDKDAAALAQQKAALDAREATFAAQAAQARRVAISAEVDGAIAAGRVLPAERGLMVELAARLGEGETIEFAAADGSKETINLFERWKLFLSALPARVETREIAGNEDVSNAATFAAPSGFTVDPERLEMHNKAEAYQVAHPGVTYEQAVSIIERG